MIARYYAAAFAGRRRVSDNRAARVGVVGRNNVSWTSQDTSNFGFKRADVRAIAGRLVGDARVVNSARFTALIECGTGCHARVDRIAAGQRFHRLSWATIVGQGS